MVLSGAASAEDSAFLSQFHSFVPAKPLVEPSPDRTPETDAQKAMLDGLVAYRGRDFDLARTDFEQAVKGGEPLAAWYLGEIYRLGRGVAADPAAAIGFYQRVAGIYDPMDTRPQVLSLAVDAVARLGDYYRDGAQNVLEPDPMRAYRLYSLAASHGHPGAQFGLAVMYLKGLGLNRNPAQAVKWLKLAATKRFIPAQTLLGDLYWNGDIVGQDRARAIMWYTLAGQTAKPDVHPQVFDRLEFLVREASAAEREAGEAKAVKWTRKNGFAAASPIPPDAE
jgi:hypothetical protein